ncbi:MAG: MBL fold metallo-hydrolase [Bacteroidota bacterium]
MRWPIFFLFIVLSSCNGDVSSTHSLSLPTEVHTDSLQGISLVVLGTLQDAGSPHIACSKECCVGLFDRPDPNRKVVSLGLIDGNSNRTFLFEATPDISSQVKSLKTLSQSKKELPDGIFLTHAHIGHYSGLMYLGKEATNATAVPVYTMPKMKSFLEHHGPWSQLVENNNIELQQIEKDLSLQITPNIRITPLQVPHRDEFSETVGYKIIGPNKSALFIPDIDKWEKWDTSILEMIGQVDYAFLDATFYSGEEIDMRDISEIPHPFIIESMELFKGLSPSEKKKIHFIHFNHTNPVLNTESDAFREVMTHGFNITRNEQKFQF